MTGAWDRDLCIDAEAIRAWGAAVVVTLIEDHEIASLGVENLGAEIVGRHMDWLHLPIADVSVPGPAFERAWAEHGEGIRARLRNGFNVLVHCKGGLGRAGTIAARLLVELGEDADEAITSVRRARPHAIETIAQADYVRGMKPAGERQPSTTHEAMRDRAVGSFMGLAVGDAVGTTLEFEQRDTKPLLTDMVGGGPFNLKPGEWTDDTAMAVALADSLQAHSELDERDLMQRFVDWQEQGKYSCTGRCFDIGITTQQALSRWKATGNPIAGSADPMSAGNGSLMRLAAVAVRHWRDRDRLRDVAARQSRTTHGAPEAVDACVAFAEILADAIEGRPRSEVLRSRIGPYASKIADIVGGSWRGRPRDDVHSSGYVSHALEAALWSVGRTADYRSAVLAAANLAEDADTTSAIAGQIAGALGGVEAIPRVWQERVAWSTRILGVAIGLFEESIK